MKEQNVALRLAGVKKEYRLGQIGGRTLQAELQSWWAGLRGKADPNRPIAVDEALYGQKFRALDGIDLTVYQGEALGIIGSNGAGKSTMLKLLSRVTAPTEGEIDIYGRISSMLEVGTGFNGQMTGRENIYLNGAILGMTTAEIDAKMEDIIEFSEIGQFIDTPVKRYSSGMFVKLAFAVAAHLNSDILIMDEVLAVGDAAFQKKCLARMREAAAQEGRTVLYVSHNMNTIRELCDRCVVLDKGKIIFDGDVEQAVALYLNRSGVGSPVELDLTQMPHAGADYDSGLRMEHLSLTGKVMPVYDPGETLTMTFRLQVSRPLKGIRLRLTLRTDTDQAIGTAWSAPVDFSEAGEYQAEYRFPLSVLVKGCLYCSVGFYRWDDLGRAIGVDHISRAFQIELQPKAAPAYWNVTANGYVALPEIQQGSIQREE